MTPFLLFARNSASQSAKECSIGRDDGGVSFGADGGVSFGEDGGVSFGEDGGVSFDEDGSVSFDEDGGVSFDEKVARQTTHVMPAAKIPIAAARANQRAGDFP
jgi:hypothetical protein